MATGGQCLTTGTPGENSQLSASPQPPLLSLQMGKENLNQQAYAHSFLSFALSAWGPSSLRRPLSKAQGPWFFPDRENWTLTSSLAFFTGQMPSGGQAGVSILWFYGYCFLWTCLQLERPSTIDPPCNYSFFSHRSTLAPDWKSPFCAPEKESSVIPREWLYYRREIEGTLWCPFYVIRVIHPNNHN